MFDRDLQEIPYEQENLPDYKLPFMTAYTMRNTQSFKHPSNLQLGDSFSEPLDLSMDRDIYINNAHLIKDALIEYLKNCLKDYNHEEQNFHQSFIFTFQAHGIGALHEDNNLQSLVQGNSLLTESQKKELIKNLQEFQEFSGVFNELRVHFGKEICQELVYIVKTLLEIKLKQFRILTKKENQDFLPKIERFWGYEEEEQLFKGSWEVYEDIDYDQIKKFAAEGVEDHAMKIYFTGRLKFLTLRQIRGELKEGVSVADKFATLVTHLSRNIFLSLSGMAQREEDGLEAANEFSLNYIQESDTIIETLTKKIKPDY